MDCDLIQDIFKVVEVEEQNTVKALISNYSLDEEAFEDAFEFVKYGLSTDSNSGYQEAMFSVQMQMVISRLKTYLDEKHAPKNKKGGAAAKGQNAKAGEAKSMKPLHQSQNPLSLLNAIQLQWNTLQQTLISSKQKQAPSTSLSAAYKNRQSRGASRATCNESLARIPGIYNESAEIEIVPLLQHSSNQPYDMFNLNAAGRTSFLHEHSMIIQKRMQEQLSVDQFDEYGMPVQTLQRVFGRVVNLSTEEDKLKADAIGLMNIENGGTETKIKLNLAEVPQYSVFEGECVVAEGYNDANSRFSVNRLIKPEPMKKNNNLDASQLQYYHGKQQGKCLQYFIAAGPFCCQDDLLYEPFRDLMDVVKRDRPHVLILLGPFLDAKNHILYESEICYKDPSTEEIVYLTYEELNNQLMKYLRSELEKMNCEVILVPSTRDIHFLNPLPQPAYKTNNANNAQQANSEKRITRMTNPSVFKVNDIVVGILNAEIIKETCFSMESKEMQGGKIDQALSAILGQRTFYPVYPGNPASPIEWSRFKEMMFPDGVTPDVLIVPSELQIFARNICDCICINPGMLVKGQAAGSYAQMTVSPIDMDKVNQGQLDNQAASRIRVDVINI